MARASRRSFGQIAKLPSGRYRARYVGPDGTRHSAPHTFDAKLDADAWLTLRRAELLKGEWTPPRAKVAALTFGTYSQRWLNERTLKPRTREHYERLLAGHLAAFEDLPLRHITPELVADWHANLQRVPKVRVTPRRLKVQPEPRGPEPLGPTMKAHAYSLLRSIMTTAVAYDLIPANPCRVPRAGSSKRVHVIRPASLPEISAIVAEMPEQYRAMTLLAAWCGLRFGELIALRRSDVTADGSMLRVRRGVVRVRNQLVVGDTKSDAGKRDVAVPPHLAPMLVDHLERLAQPGREGLLFPAEGGGYLSSSSLYRYFHPARDAAGRPDLRWHDLRHTGAVLAASTGATLAELMARLGHSTPAAAMKYQHAAQARDVIIAAKLSELVQIAQTTKQG